MLVRIQKHALSDNIVYILVDEAHSGSIYSVGNFLVKLKTELHIEYYGIVGGDQQTYAHMKNLITKFQDTCILFLETGMR